MRSQFSAEFIIDLSIVLLMVGFLVIFFSQFINTSYNSTPLSNICNLVVNAITSTSNSGGLFSVTYLGLTNLTSFNDYNISVSKGIAIVLNTGAVQPINSVSCGADTAFTANESFLFSNLAIYSVNDSAVSLAYLYGNNWVVEPSQVFGGGYLDNVSLFLTEPNSTVLAVANLSSKFVYNSSSILSGLPSGRYVFSAEDEHKPAIHVNFVFEKG